MGLLARPPSHMSCQSHESVLPSSPSRMGLDHTCTSRSSETSGVSERARNLTTSPSSLVVKEEPYDIDTVMIKWEMSEKRFGEELRDRPCQDNEGPSAKSNVLPLFTFVHYSSLPIFCCTVIIILCLGVEHGSTEHRILSSIRYLTF